MGALVLGKAKTGLVLSVLFSGLLVALLVMRVSSAGFSASTTNGSNSWQTGSVSLTDESGGTAMFNAAALDGGQSVIKCIAVTYAGSFTTGVNVHMYSTAVSGALAPYLNLTVDEGTGGTSSDCSGFTPSATDYTGTLADFGTSKTSYATGVSAWAPNATPQTKVYRLTTTVQNDPNAQGKTASATFNWTAQH